MNGVHEILELTSDIFRSWSGGSFTACPCLLWCVCFCWLADSHVVIVWDGSSRNKIKVCEASTLAGFPLLDSHWQFFQMTFLPRKLIYFLIFGGSDSWCNFSNTWTALGKGSVFFFFLNSLHYICVSPADKQEEKLNDYSVSKALQAAD